MSSNTFQMRYSRIHNMRSLFSLFSSDLAIDLGTANTLVFAHGKGIIVNEPSIIAVNKVTNEVEAVGKEAKEMLGRTPGNIVAIKPMKDGVIADFRHTEKMLNYFIQKAHNRKMMVHPRIVIGVPSEITQVEKRAVMDSLGSAYPLDKPIEMEVKGRNLIEGVPKTITIEDSEIREALSESISTIINAIRVALERTPPELSADISDRGIVLTGGGALIKNLDKRIREVTGLPVSIADDPLASVVLGTGKMLSDFKLLRKISID
jgi:actin-like ATPase involved in cell morphogenesis